MSEGKKRKVKKRGRKIGEVETSSPHKEIISVKSTDTVDDVLKLLQKQNIISAPIVDEKTTPYAGIINLIDLLTVYAFQPVFNTYNTDSQLADLKEEVLSKIVSSQKKVLEIAVGDLLGVSAESKRLWSFDATQPLAKLLDAFSVGVHRVLISHKRNEKVVYSLISQSDVVRFLKIQAYKHNLKIGKIFCQTLSQLKIGVANDKKELFTIKTTQNAITGLRHMLIRHELSALPVVNEEGKLVNTLSTSDFRGIRENNVKDTLSPVLEFVTLRRGKYDDQSISATVDETLTSVVDKLLIYRIHRIWVVDGKGKPIGVVSLTDVIKLFSVYGK